MRFKILILQRYCGLGETQKEYQIIDRLSFKKFLGLESGDKMPDEMTVWVFKERITTEGLVVNIFEDFNSDIE
jgi:IS5 family transposase